MGILMSDVISVIVCVEREHATYKSYSRELNTKFGEKVALVHFSSAKEALGYLSSNKADLVISSLMQAEINGIDLLNTCKELYPSVPFIVYTGLDYKEDFFASGHRPDAYVVRGSDLSPLIESVEKLLDIKQH